MNMNFGITSCGEKQTTKIILDVKEARRIEHLLHYLSITSQLRTDDFLFLECLREHLKESKVRIKPWTSTRPNKQSVNRGENHV